VNIAAADRRQNRNIISLFAITAAVCGTLALSWEGFAPHGAWILAGAFYATALPLFLFTLMMTFRNRG
jgi:hypothetical protein